MVTHLQNKQNLHTHTTYADGKDTPEALIGEALNRGFSSLGFSEHSFLKYSSYPNQLTPEKAVLYRKEIRSLKGKVTIILTTHYMEEAEALSNRIAIMKDGKLLICDTADNYVTDADFYAHTVNKLSKSENVFIVVSCELFVLISVDVLDVKHYKVCHLHKLCELLVIAVVDGVISYTRCVNAGMNAVLFSLSKKLEKKIYLKKWLAT